MGPFSSFSNTLQFKLFDGSLVYLVSSFLVVCWTIGAERELFEAVGFVHGGFRRI